MMLNQKRIEEIVKMVQGKEQFLIPGLLSANLLEEYAMNYIDEDQLDKTRVLFKIRIDSTGITVA